MATFNSECIEEDIGDVIQSKTTFEWSIRNFSNRCKNADDLICSPVFSHGSNMEFSWRLELYPYGRGKKNIGFSSLFLRNRSSYNVKTSFVLSIINMHNPQTMIRLEHTFTPDESDWGFCRFISRKTVIEKIRSDDVLTITCKILSVDIINNFINSRVCNTKLKAHNDIGQLYTNKNLSDVILKVNSKEFKVHKAILSARSEVFAAMFQHDMIEKSKNVVEIEDIKSEIMDAMLKFIYTGEVEDTSETTKELLVAADRYAIEDLKEICIIKLGQIIKVDNAIELLLYAERYNLDELKTKIMDFIVLNAKEIVEKPEFKLINNAPAEIISELFSKLALIPKT